MSFKHLIGATPTDIPHTLQTPDDIESCRLFYLYICPFQRPNAMELQNGSIWTDKADTFLAVWRPVLRHQHISQTLAYLQHQHTGWLTSPYNQHCSHSHEVWWGHVWKSPILKGVNFKQRGCRKRWSEAQRGLRQVHLRWVSCWVYRA